MSAEWTTITEMVFDDGGTEIIGTKTVSYAAPDSTLVPSVWACPSCGENRIDYLGWDENGEYVTCASCGAWYDPNEEG
jgi:rubredoxin